MQSDDVYSLSSSLISWAKSANWPAGKKNALLTGHFASRASMCEPLSFYWTCDLRILRQSHQLE